MNLGAREVEGFEGQGWASPDLGLEVEQANCFVGFIVPGGTG